MSEPRCCWPPRWPTPGLRVRKACDIDVTERHAAHAAAAYLAGMSVA